MSYFLMSRVISCILETMLNTIQDPVNKKEILFSRKETADYVCEQVEVFYGDFEAKALLHSRFFMAKKNYCKT